MARLVPTIALIACTAASAGQEGVVSFDLKAERVPFEAPRAVASCAATAAWVDDSRIKIDGDLSDWPKDAQALHAVGSSDPKDLGADAYVAVSPTSLYFACRVTDDVHYQRDYGDRMWKADSVQFALDPLLARTRGSYGEYAHEIGLCFVGGAPLVWRWQRPVGMKGEKIVGAELAVAFGKGRATYEAGIPLEELWPLRPELTIPCGLSFVVNDSDGGHDRENYVSWGSGIAGAKDASAFGVLNFPDKRPASVSVAAQFLPPLEPTPSTEPQEWILTVYAKTAGRLAVLVPGLVEHGHYTGHSIRGGVKVNAPEGVSRWRLLADLSRFAPARIGIRASVSGQRCPETSFGVYVYRPSE